MGFRHLRTDGPYSAFPQSLTPPVGSTFLVVAGGRGDGSSAIPTSIYWNSVILTKESAGNPSARATSTVGWLRNPDVGAAYNLQVNGSAIGSFYARWFGGVHQVDGPKYSSDETSSVDSDSLSVSMAIIGSVLICYSAAWHLTDGNLTGLAGADTEYTETLNTVGTGFEIKLASDSGTDGANWATAPPNDYGSVIGVAFYAAPAGGPKLILAMSKIYDRLQENRKKLGVGDLGNFGLKDGLWKPKEGLVTI